MKIIIRTLIVAGYFLLPIGCSSPQPSPALPATATLRPFINQTDTTPTPIVSTPATIAPLGPSATPFVHIVQQGETLLGIAIRYGVSLDDLLLVNPEVDPRILSVGQDISIPGPGGEPIDLLLPTPTAVPLSIGTVHCYPLVGQGIRCLLEVKNPLESAVEGIAVNLSLFDPVGELIAQTQANSLIRDLPPGNTSVLDATFPIEPDQPIQARAKIISAVQVSNRGDRQVPVELRNLTIDRLSNNQIYQFEGMLEFDEQVNSGGLRITIQASGYNRASEPNASNAIQFDLESNSSPIPFKLTLLSLGGEISDFDLIVEARLSNNAE